MSINMVINFWGRYTKEYTSATETTQPGTRHFKNIVSSVERKLQKYSNMIYVHH